MHVIAKHLDNALLNPVMKSMRRRDYIYASSLGFLTPDQVLGGCRRKECYRLQGFAKEVAETAYGLRRAKYGQACDEVEVSLAKQARVYVGDEVAVLDHEHRISGRIDLVILDPEANTDPFIGIEMKSVYGWGAKGLTRPGSNGALKQRDKDLAQVSFYAAVYRDGIKRWALRYMDRGTGDTLDHEIAILDDGRISANAKLTGRNVNELWAWAKSVTDHLDSKTLPPRDFQLICDRKRLEFLANTGQLSETDTGKVRRNNKVVKQQWQCVYCNYVFTCQKDVKLPYDFTPQRALDHFKR